MTDTALVPTTEAEPVGLRITPRTITMLADSTLVPDIYRGDHGSVALCLDMAQRMGLPVLTVLQNLYVIKGKPSWSSSFLIGAVNACGRFGPLRFRQVGDEGKPTWGYYVEARDLTDDEMLQGEPVTMAMAKAEGWTSNAKYQTMPGQMLRYRAAAFWARIYAPEIAHGLLTAEEAQTLPEPKAARATRLSKAITGEEEEPEDTPAAEVQDADIIDDDAELTAINEERERMVDNNVEPPHKWQELHAKATAAGFAWDAGSDTYVRGEE